MPPPLPPPAAAAAASSGVLLSAAYRVIARAAAIEIEEVAAGHGPRIKAAAGAGYERREATTEPAAPPVTPTALSSADYAVSPPPPLPPTWKPRAVAPAPVATPLRQPEVTIPKAAPPQPTPSPPPPPPATAVEAAIEEIQDPEPAAPAPIEAEPPLSEAEIESGFKLPEISRDAEDEPVPLRASTVPSSRLGRLFHYGCEYHRAEASADASPRPVTRHRCRYRDD